MKSYTDIEQSKKLVEILPIESADMRYAPFGDTHPWVWNEEVKLLEKGSVPCWSLAALLDVIPSGKALIHDKGNLGYKCICNNMDTYFHDNPVDACYKMIIKLNELNLL
jgi:hypothetical protein